MPVDFINLSFLIITSITIVISAKIIGIILITSLLITPPGVIGKLFAKSINQMILISLIIGFVSSVLGFIASYYFDIPPSGPTIVVTLFVLFIISYIIKEFTY